MSLKDVKVGDELVVVYDFGMSRERQRREVVSKVGRVWLHTLYGRYARDTGWGEHSYRAFTEATLATARRRRDAETRIRQAHWPSVSIEVLLQIDELLCRDGRGAG